MGNINAMDNAIDECAGASVSRRDFLGVVGVAGAMGAMSVPVFRASRARADEAAPEAGGQAEAAEPAAAGASVQAGLGVGSLTDEQAMQWLLDEPQVTEDYVEPDGTVIPAVYVRLRNRVNRIGQGIGSNLVGQDNWEFFKDNWSEEEAEHWLNMPMFELFTAEDYATMSDLTEQQALELCDELSGRGLLMRVNRGGIEYFHVIPMAHGLYEFGMGKYNLQWMTNFAKTLGSDYYATMLDCGSPLYRALPVSKDVVRDGELLPYTDWEAMIRRNSIISVSPCQCRLNASIMHGDEPQCDHPLETCIATGEQAQYYIENGVGRQITPDEAIEMIKGFVDLGMVPETMYNKSCDVICNCHGDCCGCLRGIIGIQGQGDAVPNATFYTLEHDEDACIKCGACAERCPLMTITMDEQSGYPVVGPCCVGCGQCVLVCPTSARILAPKDEVPELPSDFIHADFAKSKVRVEKGYIRDFVGPESVVVPEPAPAAASTDEAPASA